MLMFPTIFRTHVLTALQLTVFIAVYFTNLCAVYGVDIIPTSSASQ